MNADQPRPIHNEAELTEAEKHKTLKKVVFSSFLGNFIEWFDYASYSYLATVIALVFFPGEDKMVSTMMTFGVFALAFLVRPLGAIFWGNMGDKKGRKWALSISILMMSGATFLIGCLPGYAVIGVGAPLLLLLMRMVQSFSASGEYAGAATFIAEYSPKNHRGFYCSMVPASTAVGLLVGSLFATWMFNTFGASSDFVVNWGWRIPFLCSAVLVIIGLYVRLRMTETPIFRKAVEQDRVVKHPLRSLLPYWKEVLLGTFAMGITYSLFYVLGTWSLSYAVKVMKPPFSQNEYLAMQMVSVVFFAIFIFVTCIYSDKLGRKTVLISTTLATLVFSLFAMQSLQHNVLTVMLFLCVGFALMGGLFGPCGAYLPELFPTHVRYSGAGLSYNLAAILGGAFAPAISTALVKSTGAVESVGWYLAVMSLLALIALFLIKESKDEDYEK